MSRGIMASLKSFFGLNGSHKEVSSPVECVTRVISKCCSTEAWPHVEISKKAGKIKVRYDVGLIALISRDLDREGTEILIKRFADDLTSTSIHAAAVNMRIENTRKKLDSESQKYTE